MSMRFRKYVWLAVTLLVSLAWTRVAGDWSDVAFFTVGAGVLAVVVLAGLFWIEFAPDGAFRRQSRA